MLWSNPERLHIKGSNRTELYTLGGTNQPLRTTRLHDSMRQPGKK